VNRVRHYLASLTITPLGGVVLVVLLVAVGLFLFGPSTAQMPALIVVIVLMVGVVGGVPLGRGGAGGWRNPSLAGRRGEFNPPTRNVSDDPLSASAEAELWRKERERYTQDDQRA
jgi:hypothetical protein